MSNRSDNERIWTSSFIKVFLVALTMRMCTQMQNTILPLYVTDIGYNTVVAGLITSVYTLSALVFRPAAGSIMDKRGRKIVLIIGTGLFAATSGLYYFALPIWLVLIVRAVSGVGFCWNGTATSTLASDCLPDSKMSEGIGYMGLAQTVAQAIGPGIALSLVGVIGYPSLFLMIFFLCIAVLLVCLTVNSAKDKKNRTVIEARYEKALETKADSKENVVNKIFEKDSWKISALVLFVSVQTVSVNAFLSVCMSQRISGNFGMFFTVAAVVMALVRLVSGKISAKYGSPFVVIPGFVCLGISMVGIAFAQSMSFLMVCALFYGVGMGSLQPEINALAVVAAKKERRGAANATFLMMMDIGNGVGSAVLGYLADIVGFTNMFLFAGIMSVCGMLLFQIYRSKKMIA